MPVFMKSYKYRIYPNKEQQKYLNRNFGAVRFVWNRLVENFNAYGTDNYIKNYGYSNFKKDYPWLDECSSAVLVQKMRDFLEFQRQYFNKKRKKKLGKPKFKKKGVANDSIKFTNQNVGISHFNFENSTIKLPKIKQPIKVVFIDILVVKLEV
jgi:putative transposase